MNDAILNLILAVVGLACACVTSYVIPLLKAKYTAEQLKYASEWAKKAVACAEIIFDVPKSGAQKKQFCIEKLTQLLNSKKEVISSTEMELLIESAVQTMKTASVTTGRVDE